MHQMLKTRTLMAALVPLGLLLIGCHLGGDVGLDEPATVTQITSPANVVIKNDVVGSAIGVTTRRYQSGVAMPGDLDGDGYDDLVVTNNLCVQVIYGSPTWPHVVQVEQQPTLIPQNLGESCGQGSMTIDLPADLPLDYFLPSVAAAGDVDRDGYADFLVSYSTNAAPYALKDVTYLVYGGPTRIAGRQQIAELASVFAFEPNERVKGIGDINGDGYADLAVVNNGNVLVFLGRAKRFVGHVSADQAGATVSGAFGLGLHAAGDLNGDGYADFLVSSTAILTDTGSVDAKVWMVPGRKDFAGIISVPEMPLVEGPIPFEINRSLLEDGLVSPLGDLNGDGFDDLAFTTLSADQGVISYATNILYGRSDLLAQRNQADATLPGSSVLASADVDGDGILDLIASDPSIDNGNGAVYVRTGTHDRLVGNIDLSLNTFRMASSCPSNVFGENVGYWLAAGSDVDGDGLGDILVGASVTQNADGYVSSDAATNTGHAYLVRGVAVKTGLGR